MVRRQCWTEYTNPHVQFKQSATCSLIWAEFSPMSQSCTQITSDGVPPFDRKNELVSRGNSEFCGVKVRQMSIHKHNRRMELAKIALWSSHRNAGLDTVAERAEWQGMEDARDGSESYTGKGLRKKHKQVLASYLDEGYFAGICLVIF